MIVMSFSSSALISITPRFILIISSARCNIKSSFSFWGTLDWPKCFLMVGSRFDSPWTQKKDPWRLNLSYLVSYLGCLRGLGAISVPNCQYYLNYLLLKNFYQKLIFPGFCGNGNFFVIIDQKLWLPFQHRSLVKEIGGMGSDRSNKDRARCWDVKFWAVEGLTRIESRFWLRFRAEKWSLRRESQNDSRSVKPVGDYRKTDENSFNFIISSEEMLLNFTPVR